ncbi:MAG: DNA methyltransferase [Candidatus Micrarchaeota archaeon]
MIEVETHCGYEGKFSNQVASNVEQVALSRLSPDQREWVKQNCAALGVDLSFAGVRESERTKHVHRLHPYLGKFIPQLVDVFLEKYFKEGQCILDPFAGSATTLVEANTLKMNSIGVELSEFSYLIGKVKTTEYDLNLLEKEVKDILAKTSLFSRRIESNQNSLVEDKAYLSDVTDYFKTWYSDRAIKEIYHYRSLIPEYNYQDVLKVILSRSARSARQIAHYDLARPLKPVKQKYWCIKHNRYCEPIGEALKFITRYSFDTIDRIREFDKLRTNCEMTLLQSDSRKIRLPHDEINGIFTSPPYLGLIDYHDQHKYAYDLFDFKEFKDAEIGSTRNGKSNPNAKAEYQQSIEDVFKNVSPYLTDDAKIFIVVNDKRGIYPAIADECGFKTKRVFHRPVLFRTERDNFTFTESIYHFEKN